MEHMGCNRDHGGDPVLVSKNICQVVSSLLVAVYTERMLDNLFGVTLCYSISSPALKF